MKTMTSNFTLYGGFARLTFSYRKLEELLQQKPEGTNNQFGIDNHLQDPSGQLRFIASSGFFKPSNLMKNTPEYNDLQLVLDQFAKSKT